MDLNGKLVDRNAKYDPEYLNKILKTMIYVEEMDSILLKVKGQGKDNFNLQVKSHFIWLLLEKEHVL